MSDLSLLKAIASDFNRIDTIVYRNDFVKNKIRKEINDSPEKKKLDEFDDKAKKRLKSMTMVLLLFIVPAFLCNMLYPTKFHQFPLSPLFPH